MAGSLRKFDAEVCAGALTSSLRRSDPPVGVKLCAEESAAISAQLIREIETLPGDDLQPRAIATLKAKNRLSAEDAKRVEDAFAARMQTLGAQGQ
jgi:hypothetical protein